MISGGIAVAATSPYFVSRALPKIFQAATYALKRRKSIKNFQRSFYYLKSQDMIKIEDRGGQIYISLTEADKKKAANVRSRLLVCLVDFMKAEKCLMTRCSDLRR